MNILLLYIFVFNILTASQGAFLSSIASVLQSLSTATSTSQSGINFSSGVYTVLILPRSSTRSSSTTSTSTSTSTSTITSSSSSTISSSTSQSVSTSTVTPTTTITPTTTTSTTSSSSTITTTVTPTTTITPTSSVCAISVTTVSVFPSSYCTTIVLCGPAVSGCPVYNSSFMSQLSSLASSRTATSSGSTLTVTSTSTSTSTTTQSGIVVSSVSTGVVTSGGQTIVTSGAIVIEINDDGSTTTVFQAASARKYRANSTNSSGAFIPSKSGVITAVITLLSAFLLGIVTV